MTDEGRSPQHARAHTPTLLLTYACTHGHTPASTENEAVSSAFQRDKEWLNPKCVDLTSKGT